MINKIGMKVLQLADKILFGLAIAYSSVLIVVMLLAILLIQIVVGERRLGRRATGAGQGSVAIQGAG